MAIREHLVVNDTELSSQQILDCVIEGLPVSIWIIDRDGKFTYLDTHSTRQNKARPEDFIGRTVEELFAEHAPEVYEAAMQALAGEHYSGLIRLTGAVWSAEYFPLKDQSGEIVGAAGVAYDTTERARTLSSLEQSEELNRRIVESVPAGITLVSPKGEILEANSEAQRILGLTYDKLTNRYVVDFAPVTIWEDGSPCPPEDYPVSRCLATQEAQPQATIGVRQADGRTSWAVFTAVPAHHPLTGDFMGAVVTFLDINQRREDEKRRLQLEHQLAESQRLDALGRLAGGISHDLNNILSAILGRAGVLKERHPPGSPDHTEAIAIEHAAQRAARLTGQLLGFARRGKLRTEVFDVHDTLNSVLLLLSSTLNKNVKVVQVRTPEPSLIEGDSSQIEQVFLNLALNAYDAIDGAGHLSLVTELVQNDDGQRYILVSVSDTGSGMNEEVRERIFEPFFTTKSPDKGSGMGLAMVYGIVENHGGHIEVSSEVGKGSTFRIYLPVAEAIARASLVRQPSSAGQKPKILVVDDEAVVRESCARQLEVMGFSPIVVSSGAEAVDQLSKQRDEIALIILDLIMPEMDGEACYRTLQSIRRDVPVILTTGFSRNGVAQRVLDAGARHLLMKPYTFEALKAAVNELLTEVVGTIPREPHRLEAAPQ